MVGCNTVVVGGRNIAVVGGYEARRPLYRPPVEGAVRRATGLVFVVLGLALAVAGGAFAQPGIEPPTAFGTEWLWKATLVASTAALAYGIYERGLERFNEHPDRIAFPVSRSR